jgi:glyoxylase-like metal-dependent hydrolase (beta-lactamase superfamily II)
MRSVICLDTKLSGRQDSVASYLIPYSGGAVLVDTGSGSTQEELKSCLAAHGLTPRQVTHVLLTHIHLDHAGAAGWLARQGAMIYAHPIGVPHLFNPEKLIASASRIYGDKMEELWGDFLSVPEASLAEVRDGMEIAISELRITGLHTPGHAEHHVAYAFQDTCFTGDAGGVRKPGPFYVRMPFVPPETHLGKWRASLDRISGTGCTRLALTHFGIYEEAAEHLGFARGVLDEVEEWLEGIMPDIPDVETLQRFYTAWLHKRGHDAGLNDDMIAAYDFASPVQMDASGLFRYWNKVKKLE